MCWRTLRKEECKIWHKNRIFNEISNTAEKSAWRDREDLISRLPTRQLPLGKCVATYLLVAVVWQPMLLRLCGFAVY